jgi:serine/threonine protein kinase
MGNAGVMPLPVGAVLAGYRIERVLGTGGMGVVYLAKNPTLSRRDALKVLGADLSRDPGFRERFVREADIASMLFHPNIVSVYGRGETDSGQLWIAMQYVEGTDAEQALREGTMTPNRAIRIVREVAKALDYAHDRNVVHHDVKPANFLLSKDFGDSEHVLLSDFGVARNIGDGEPSVNSLLTATLAYAAPEVIAGDPIDGRADLYSLGCTLFRLLTGKQPFYRAKGESATARAHLDAAPPRVSDHLAWAPRQLDQVIAKALAKDPARRFASAREFATAATEAIRGTAPALPAPSPTADPTSGPHQMPRHRAKRRSTTPPPLAPKPLTAPRPDHSQFPSLSDQLGLPVVNPKPAQRMSTRPLFIGAAAVALVTAVVGFVVWSQRPSPAPTAGPTAPAPAPVNGEAETRLTLLLPAGYPPGSCTPATAPAGAAAVLSCGATIEPNGPSSATYTLARNPEALRSAFDAVVQSAVTVVCPGNIQSPGPWRHNANPTVPVGRVFCGNRGGRPLVAWTNDSERLLSFVQNDVPGPTLDQLYAWWSTHS